MSHNQLGYVDHDSEMKIHLIKESTSGLDATIVGQKSREREEETGIGERKMERWFTNERTDRGVRLCRRPRGVQGVEGCASTGQIRTRVGQNYPAECSRMIRDRG
jgi:hypothetical protein